MMMMIMKLPSLPCAEKLELVLSTAPRTRDNTDKDSKTVASNSPPVFASLDLYLFFHRRRCRYLFSTHFIYWAFFKFIELPGATNAKTTPIAWVGTGFHHILPKTIQTNVFMHVSVEIRAKITGFSSWIQIVIRAAKKSEHVWDWRQ